MRKQMVLKLFKYLLLFLAVNLSGQDFLFEYSKFIQTNPFPSDYWSFYPFNNSLADASGNGNDIHNFGVSYTSDRFGTANSALNATSALGTTIPASAIGASRDSMTILFFSKATPTDVILVIGQTLSVNGAIRLDKQGDNSVRLLIYKTSGFNFTTKTTTDNMDAWFMTGFTWAGGVGNLYINDDTPTAFNYSADTQILRNDSLRLQFSSYTDRYIDDIYIWHRVLEQWEIDSVYYHNGWTTP